MKKPIFQGSCTALITPFTENGVNYDTLFALIEMQIQNGTAAIVLCGTTGEGSTMSDEEQLAVIRRGAAYIGGRIPLIAGTGSNDTAHAVARSKAAQDAGADAVLVVTPYYNKATPTGLVRHYCAVADALTIPVIAYNVPSRTGVDMPIAVYEQFSRHPNINGVKEASGNIAKVSAVIGRLGDDFHVWSGNDDQNVPILSLGGKGVISVLSNLCPGYVSEMTAACFAGDYPRAAQMQNRIMPLIDALFCEVNPIPVKAALGMLGYAVGSCRLPLCELEPAHRELVKNALSLL